MYDIIMASVSLRSTVIGVLVVTFMVLATLQTTNIGNRSTTKERELPSSPHTPHNHKSATLSANTSKQSPQCQEPVQKLIFIKTHKTGSSTIATTVVRYADEKHLTLATPILTQIFHQVKPFSHNMVLSFGDMGNFDMLASHARYNKEEMDLVVSSPKYITILRDPVKQLESAYSYYSMAKHIGLKGDGDHELEAFMKQPKYYFENFNYFMKVQSWNGQIWDLGLEHGDHLNETRVQRKIQQIDNEFELVMINEYFDESLLLLRKHLCWDWMDIVYISKGVRKQSWRHEISPKLAVKIRQWNSADVQLYDYFNRTFWQKLKEYGPNFQKDLLFFQKLRRNVSTTCIDEDSNSNYDKRVEHHELRPNAPTFCKNLIAEVMFYVNWMKFKYVCYRLLLPVSIVLLICVSFMCVYRRCNTKNDQHHYQLLQNLEESPEVNS